MARENTQAWHCLLGVTLWLAGCAARDEPSATKVDFHRDVAPIFQARCESCHGATRQQGGLRLDERTFARRGGLSGKPLNAPAAENELLRRIRSDDSTVLMPREGGRLTDRDIEIIRQWIEAGTPWPETAPLAGSREFVARYGTDLEKRLSVAGSEVKIFVLLAFAVLMGAAERIRRTSADDKHWSSGTRHIVLRFSRGVTAAGFLAGVLSVVVWDLVEFGMRQSTELASTEDRLRAAVATGEFPPFALADSAPMPLRPKNTPQLGGVYYRGNDERHERLFNGGYYRTATMRLSLIDEQERPVNLGQALPGAQLFLDFEIERAPQATLALFTDQLMGEVLLSRRTSERKEPFPADEPAAVKPVAVNDRWVARYHVGDYDGEPDAALDGIVYVYTSGKRHHESVSGTRHYGIVYSLRIRERVLQVNSELWMGPIFVPSNFQYPDPSRITLPEWFDVNPIPEIIGERCSPIQHEIGAQR